MANKKKNKRPTKRHTGATTVRSRSSSSAATGGTGDTPSPSRLPLGWLGVGAMLVIGVLLVLLIPNWFDGEADEGTGKRLSSQQRTNNRSGTTDNGDETQPVSREENWRQLDNPEADGWHTEVFSDHAMAKLKKLGKLIVDPSLLDDAHVSPLLADRFSCLQLLPTDLTTAYQDSRIHVQRAALETETNDEKVFEGTGGLITAIQQLAKPFEESEDARFKFKLFRVEPGKGFVTTKQYFAISGTTEDGVLEQNATWVSRWNIGDAALTDAEPRLASIEVTAFEQVTVSERTLYSDCTQSVLESNASYREHLLRGYNHWLDRTESRPYWERLGTPGLAVGDANGDGLEDVYLCQERGLPNRLYLQNADGTVRDVSQSAGVDWLEDSRGALFVDLDNDGDQDLVVSVSGGVVISENAGDAHFTIRNVLKTNDDTKSLCAADYDLDGKLDIYVTVYYPNVFDGDMEVTGVAAANAHQVLYDTNRGGGNSLFQNQIAGDQWQFVDVTETVGLAVNNARYSLAAAWEDYDNDGDQDLYVANDYGRNNLYRNDDGKFVDVSEQARVEDYNFAMSATWGDYNRDGLMDIYVGNMFSSAGNRITFQDQFKEGASEEEKSRFQHLARGNTLFKNVGQGEFEDVTDECGVAMGRWAWSTNFVDLNNDGWQDLVVANGMITTEDTGDC